MTTALWAIVEKEIERILRVWTQTLVPPIVTSTLFILIFGYSLGSRIDVVRNVAYLDFIIPGLVLMGVITSSYLNGSFSLYISRFHGNIQEILTAPVPYWQIILGFTLASMFRGLVVGISILLISLLFASVVIYSVFVLLYFIVMVSLLFSLAGIITALWATSFDKVNVFNNFLITPLTYLGGVFYSITMLPQFWQDVAKFNPILYMVDGFRYGFLGVADVSPITSAVLVLLLVVAFFSFCVHLFKKGYGLRT